MAFAADCGVSTVLEEFRVTSTVGFPVPGECRATGQARATRLSQPDHLLAPAFLIPNS
jgi:hypothetical protein